MHKNYITKLLQSVGIPDSKIPRVERSVEIKSYPSGKVIWNANDSINKWFYIIDGMVLNTITESKNVSVPIIMYGKDTWFGEQPIISQKATILEFRALTDTELMGIPSGIMLHLLETVPEFCFHVSKLVSWRAHAQLEMLVVMRAAIPSVRVVLGLTLIAEALKSNWERPDTDGLEGGITLPANHHTLAGLCGTSRTTFSECIHILESQGLVTVKYNKLTLNGIEAWRNVAMKIKASSNHIGDISMADVIHSFHSNPLL